MKMAKHIKDENTYDDGTYVAKKSKKGNIIALIVCMLIAFAIWIYAKNAEIKELNEQTTAPENQMTEQANGTAAGA